MDLVALAERVAAASEGSQELDEAIERALGRYNAFNHYTLGDDDQPAYVPTPYTTSLDSAKTLVPEGWGWTGGESPSLGGAAVVFPDGATDGESSKAKTLALALVSACLRVASQQGEG